jgi:SanA protein
VALLGLEQKNTYLFDDVPVRDVAIVPGAKVWKQIPSHVLEDRLLCAEALYRAGKVRRILVTGDHGTKGYDETTTMERFLLARGIPAEDVVKDHAGFRTLDSMHRARQVFGIDDAIVCTQAFHLPRALFLARSFGIDAVGVEADRRTYRGAAWNAARETVARTVAVLERGVLRRGARVLGPKPTTSTLGSGRAAGVHARRERTRGLRGGGW